MTKQGDAWVLNGSKWWSSGAGDPRCAVYIVMGKSSPGHADTYKQQSVILVPASTPGITVHRMLSVFGYDDAPHGHGHISFNNVRVPAESMVLGEGRGFEIIQGRLGPGRIHHAMRSIGGAERALDLFVTRINDPNKVTFGSPLSQNPVMLARIAECRIEIDAARLIVCNAAVAIDNADAAAARKEIAEAKVLVPKALLKTLDYAIQAFGAMGVCQDTPLAQMWAQARTMRVRSPSYLVSITDHKQIVDGPDEVHMLQLGRNENKRGPMLIKKLEAQKAAQLRQLSAHGMTTRDPLYIGKSTGEASKL
jgi:acyl-CoA dehydrogenase